LKGAVVVCFGDSRIGPKRSGELAAVNPNTITANLKEVFVVAKLAASHDAMKFFGRPMSFCVRAIGRITWTNRRKSHPRMMNKPKDILRSHSREESRLVRRTEGGGRVGGRRNGRGGSRGRD
jgi:hypothetical protein